MCGIAGTTRRLDTLSVESALRQMRHRGPDGVGSFVSDEVSALHRRLSIIDLDERSLQPMWNHEHTIAVVYNGEIYNYKELRSELEQEYVFTTTSDTEVLLHGYHKFGSGIWAKLSGMFAASIIDLSANKVVLARDHAGMKPLFYYFDGKTLTWASEMRTLFDMMPGIAPEAALIPERLEEYFVLGYIPSPSTLYRDVFQVPKSSVLEYSFGAPNMTFTSFLPLVTEGGSLEDAVANSIDAHLVADVPVGLFYSGGVDSSILAAFLKARGVDLKTYSLIMPGRAEDYHFGKEIAALLGLQVSHREFDTHALIESYVGVTRAVDMPIADIALFPTWFISREAKKDVTVVLSGEGGDELFFGYPRQRILQRAVPLPAFAPLLSLHQTLPEYRGKGLIHQNLAAYSDSAAYYIAICSPASSFLEPEAYKRVLASVRELSDPLFYDRDLYLENMLLRKLDLMTMQHSLEGRLPLLAPALYNFSTNAATSFREANGAILKPALKKILEAYVPQRLIERKKSGFGFNARMIFESVPLARNDAQEAHAFLKKRGVRIACDVSAEELVSTKPGAALSAILLYRSIMNNTKS